MKNLIAIALKDISHGEPEVASLLANYQHKEDGKRVFIYQPKIVRFINEVYIQSWEYYFNEHNQILRSHVHVWGEGPVHSTEDAIFVEDNYMQVVDLALADMLANKDQFDPEFFNLDQRELDQKFSFEVILQQEECYRLRVRRLFSHDIVIDFFYDKLKKEIVANKSTL